jgi:hypothetical protein
MFRHSLYNNLYNISRPLVNKQSAICISQIARTRAFSGVNLDKLKESKKKVVNQIVHDFDKKVLKLDNETIEKNIHDGDVISSPQFKEEFILEKNRPDHNQLSLWNKMKLFTKQYGIVYFSTYWLTWGGVTYGVYKGLDMGWITYENWKWLHLDTLHEYYEYYGEKLGYDMEKHPITPKTDKMLIAFMTGKITKPFQMVFSIGITPSIARYLGYAPKKTESI